MSVLAAFLTILALAMTGLYAGSEDYAGDTLFYLLREEMTGIGLDKFIVFIAVVKIFGITTLDFAPPWSISKPRGCIVKRYIFTI